MYRTLLSLLVLNALILTGRAAPKPPALKVSGNQIVTDKGVVVHLRGVNVASMEWTNNGEGHIVDTVNQAIKVWHANIVRLPLAQDRWFGKAPEQSDGGKAYRALVKQVVDTVASQRAYIILDLHWSDCNEWGQQIGQHLMPDENSLAFWKDFAPKFKNNPAVIFDLYNEPHDVSWDIWLNGGQVTERSRRTGNASKTYRAVGMQELLDAVRATGTKNPVLAGGLDWAYDMSGFLNGKTLSDPKGRGVIYANHAYPIKGDTVAQWITKMEAAAAKLPVIVSEFGAQSRGDAANSPNKWVEQVMTALKAHDWNWTAWDLHPAAGPCLVSDWNYTPTPSFGALVKAALESN